MSDRERNQFDASVVLTPLDPLNISLSYNYRKNDYDSGVSSTQPLAGVAVANAAAQAGVTAGNQLGLLEDKRNAYSMNVGYTPVERLSLNAYASREEYEATQRGMAFDENNRITASFDWNAASKQWMATIDDKTNTVGLGVGFVIIPKKLNFVADYSYSYGTVEIDYSGYGDGLALNSNTYYYAFTDPEKVSHRQHTLNATLEYEMFRGWIMGLGYLYDRYKIKDWMQEPSGGWVEQVGSEYFLRDSSQDTRWGNRLVSLGSYLGPSYEAHVGMVTLAYRW
ncbi:MAG: MtrB/PioB family outer membrane beta-barrel protein [Deltaproteobacteria bacterium]|nr:MtrB/PioB family outer membrane beta-barrel protein [Deltaproteobacteria bacterium]